MKYLKYLFAPFFYLMPFRMRQIFIRLAIRGATSGLSPRQGLLFTFGLEDEIYQHVKWLGAQYLPNVHLKSHLMHYERFFLKHVTGCAYILDLGCGQGTIANEIGRLENVKKVIGVDLDGQNLQYARKNCAPKTSYIHGDALQVDIQDPIDCVILSNVLEHIERRVDLLAQLQKKFTLKKILIRVPLFERDWRIPLRKEIGAEWRLDTTHYTEYTLESFKDEMDQAALNIVSLEVRWGEIWAVTVPKV